MTSTAPLAPHTQSPGSRCVVCQHDVTSHDAIGLRFCDATQANALTRDCICRVKA